MSKKKKKISPLSKNLIFLISVKVFLILIFLFGMFHTTTSFDNSVSVLAVSTVDDEVRDGSIIDLHLEVRPGSGNIYVNLETFEQIDTQASIVNSQKISCQLFNLPCEEYDFYYTFEGDSLILQGPSASAAIAVLAAKTVNKVHLDQSTVITGLLNSGGVIGNVGGVEQKVQVAAQKGFKRVLIPQYSSYNITGNESIEVIKVLDVIDVYNSFNGRDFKLKTEEVSDETYNVLMEQLSDRMCSRTDLLFERIDNSSYEENSSESRFYSQAEQGYNSGLTAIDNSNFYSAGSFCYGANINLRVLQELDNEPSVQELNLKLEALRDKIISERLDIKSNQYLASIETVNDFYAYLLVNDRIEEALDFVEEGFEIDFDITNPEDLTLEELRDVEEVVIREKTSRYASAYERFNTVEMWESFIVNSGRGVKFNEGTLNDACVRINREVSIRSQLLPGNQANLFGDSLVDLNQHSGIHGNKFLCIYKGIELSGRINTVLNAIGVDDNESEMYAEDLREIAYSRLLVNANGDFPLIPYIYYEYSGDLFNEDEISSSVLYSNYALAYTDLNIYLEEEKTGKSFFNLVVDQLYDNFVFLGAFLVLLAFLS